MRILDINDAIKEMRNGKRIIISQSNRTASIHKGDSHVSYCGTKLTQKNLESFLVLIQNMEKINFIFLMSGLRNIIINVLEIF